MHRISHYILIVIFLVLPLFTTAQIQIQGDSITCLGDLTNFSYKPPAGQTVSGFSWAFGDSYTSSDPSPSHLYKAIGTMTVTLNVTFNGGGSAQESRIVQVVGLPKTDLQFITSSDSCEYTNNICFKDFSSPAKSSQTILTRNMIWGDGKYDNQTWQANASLCHRYKTPDTYYVEMQLKDIYGCTSYAAHTVTIKEGVKVDLKVEIEYPNCDSARICVYQNSEYTTSKGIKYTWNFNGTTDANAYPASSKHCEILTASKYYDVSVTAETSDGCKAKDSYVKSFQIAPSANRSFTMAKRTLCFGEGVNTFEISAQNDEIIRWSVNGGGTYVSSKYVYPFRDAANNPTVQVGWNKVRCQIIRGQCNMTLEDSFYVNGPIAGYKLYNVPQCGPQRKVFFVEKSEYEDTANMSFRWDIIDKQGDNCTINRAQNVNKYKNCNTTMGWFGKHVFSGYESYPGVLSVTDVVTGCTDDLEFEIKLDACGQCRPLETIEVCQGSQFLPGSPQPNDPLKYSLDTGKTWYPFRSIMPDVPPGLYGLGLIYEFEQDDWAEDFGDDSIKIHDTQITFVDTLFLPDAVKVIRSLVDSITIGFEAGCDPVVGYVELQTGKFKPGDRLNVNWGDGHIDRIVFTSDSTLKRLTHEFDEVGLNSSVLVSMISAEGCRRDDVKSYNFGYKVTLKNNESICVGNDVCFTAGVVSTDGQSWSQNPALGSVDWLIDGKPVAEDTMQYCLTLRDVGEFEIGLITHAASGCTDTTYEAFKTTDVVARVTNDSKEVYCRGIRQFKDSSSILPPVSGSGYIAEFLWDFGTGVFSGWDEDPVRAFDGDTKVVHIRHAVKSFAGCWDTTEFDLIVLRSVPDFEIGDSIGCAEFTVDLTNKSTGATQFIWELGDEKNTTKETFTTDPFSHTYKQPGEYFIRLIGVDSFYDPVFKNTHYCHTVYPDLSKEGVRILVLPNSVPDILGPDTLCANQPGLFTSQTDTSYDIDQWVIEQHNGIDTLPGSSIQTSWSKKGSYDIKLYPVFHGEDVVPKCAQPAVKTVVVPTVKAEFVIDPNSHAPVFHFINQSQPLSADHIWNFGDPQSGDSNSSNLVHPSHNFGERRGDFTVCLSIQTNQGCTDKYCLPLFNQYGRELEMFNVFTPGNSDGLNDEFTIVLGGEEFHKLEIFNRWGERVFLSEAMGDQEMDLTWNGRVNNTGPECPPGTYFFVLDYSYYVEPGIEKRSSGTVTLIR